jgi:hypothetical protein
VISWNTRIVGDNGNVPETAFEEITLFESGPPQEHPKRYLDGFSVQ